jgi:RNA polymerase sigma-70 factor (ECF subfamily)
MGSSGSNAAYDTLEIRKLIAQAKKGDQTAFTRLVREYEHLVFKYAYKLCRDRDKAEEAFQDTFVNVYRRLKQFDGRSKFSSWLYKIVSNNCLMKLRKSGIRRASVSLDEHPDLSDAAIHDEHGHVKQVIASWKESPLEGMLNGELRTKLDEAIVMLPPPYRAVFLLRDIEERSARETARILNLSVAAVKSRLHRARSFLRERLNPYMAR